MNRPERKLIAVIFLLLAIGGASRLWFYAAEPEVQWVAHPEEKESEELSTDTLQTKISDQATSDSMLKKEKVSSVKKRSKSKRPAPLRPGERININAASSEQLQRLPGIGPALAERIIAYRSENGEFSGPESLLKVKGIGKSRLDSLRSRVTFHK